MLVLTRRPGESIEFSDGKTQVTVKVLRLAGNQVQVGIDAPPEIEIWRTELARREVAP